MTKQEFTELVEIYLSEGHIKTVIKEMGSYILELEKRLEKLESKDFVRNEPLIGDY